MEIKVFRKIVQRQRGVPFAIPTPQRHAVDQFFYRTKANESNLHEHFRFQRVLKFP